MSGTKSTPWVIGTAFLALVLIAGAWFGLISPKLVQAADTVQANEDALMEQDRLRQRLALLKQQHENLDEYRAELAALRLQVPTTAEIDTYTLALQAKAEEHGVTIVNLAPGIPQTLAVAVADPAPATAETTTDAEEGAGSDAETDVEPDAVTPAPTPAGPELVGIPVSVNAVGSYQAVASFLEAVQTGTDRLLLVTTLNGLSLDDAEAASGRPATSRGDVEITVDGYAYVLPESDTATPPADGEAPAEPTEPAPLPQSDRNPFSPVA